MAVVAGTDKRPPVGSRLAPPGAPDDVMDCQPTPDFLGPGAAQPAARELGGEVGEDVHFILVHHPGILWVLCFRIASSLSMASMSAIVAFLTLSVKMFPVRTPFCTARQYART